MDVEVFIAKLNKSFPKYCFEYIESEGDFLTLSFKSGSKRYYACYLGDLGYEYAAYVVDRAIRSFYRSLSKE